jgi:formate hydrogenlyase subunit 4
MAGVCSLLVLAQVAAVAFVLLLAPLYKGVLDRLRARAAFRVGPPVVQPYRDLRKWFAKETVRSGNATWVSAWAPVFYFIAPVIVAMLIPVLTAFPLPLAFMGDMLGGGFILTAGGFWLLLAALDNGGPFSALGTSRIRLVGVFAEPLVVLAIFVAAAVGGTTIPFVVNAHFGAAPWRWSAVHGLELVAWFLFVVAETGRIPVDNPGSAQELSLIDPGRTFEASGPDLALYEWGGWMKFMVLVTVGVNVLATPWGLAPAASAAALGLAALATAAKLLAFGVVLILFEVSFAKLRLLRIPEFLAASALVALLAGIGAVVVG